VVLFTGTGSNPSTKNTKAERGVGKKEGQQGRVDTYRGEKRAAKKGGKKSFEAGSATFSERGGLKLKTEALNLRRLDIEGCEVTELGGRRKRDNGMSGRVPWIWA